MCNHCRQVADAIPIPGFLETLQPTLQAARSANTPLNQDPRVDSSLQQSRNSSSSSLGGSSTPGRRPASASAQLLAVAAAAASPLLAEQQQQLLVGAAPALDQLASVINEVRLSSIVMGTCTGICSLAADAA